MDLMFTIVLLSLAAAPLALLSGWLDRRESRPLGALVNGRDSESWWRATMPWPKGVQEEDELTWTFRDRQPPAAPPSKRWPGRDGADETDELRVKPIHLRPQVRRR
jgi:hypothetical protein